MSAVEKTFHAAAQSGRVGEVMSLLRDNPGLNINWSDKDQWTALHHASIYGHAEVVKVLLAHPGINVNCKDEDGSTPFSFDCWNGNVSVVCVLLKDPRVDVTMADKDGQTPLWGASYKGKHEVVEWLIASDRYLGDIKNTKGKLFGEEYTALEIARQQGKSEVVTLLERFLDNPAQTRQQLRLKLNVNGI